LRGKEIIYTEKGDRALGISAKVEYSTRKYGLQKEDLLIIYSDGVTEAQNESGDFFGQERLEECVKELENMTTSEAGALIVEKVQQFSGEAPQNDDLSIILIKNN
jgi:sigma-B regulation protein RsbU (phosphoserine phosphatase)